MLHFQLTPDVSLDAHANWITRTNSAIMPIAPNLATFAQRAYMKVSQELWPHRQFKTAFGATMEGDVSDFVFKRMCFFGLWEPALTRFMIRTIRRGQTVVDLGANHGYFSLLMSRLVGEGKVIAIEASSANCESLRRNIGLNRAFNVSALNVAVADHAGTVELVDPDPGNSGNPTTMAAEDHEEGELVPCDRLLPILGADVGRVSFIKIDIEGAERPALEDIIANKDLFARPLTIVSEVSKANRDIIDSFTDAGFDARIMPNDYGFGSYLRAYDIDGRTLPLSEKRSETDDYVFQLAF